MKKSNTQDKLYSLLIGAYRRQAGNLSDGPIHLRVDDRENGDIYPGFCDIHLTMSYPQVYAFTLILDNVPFDDEVKAVSGVLGGTWSETRTGECLTLNLSVIDKSRVTRLANAIRKVVGRGKRYLDRNWKWIAPRTARSLDRLASYFSSTGQG